MNFLGYDYQSEALLEEALTTPSYRMDHPDAHDNQRLEFLGDAVLGFLAAECLYARFPTLSEGDLTVRRIHMVSAPALCEAANRLSLAGKLRRNRAAQPLRWDSKILADAVEALIGAAYLDGGFPAARLVFDTLRLNPEGTDGEWAQNPKGTLQILVQALKPPRHPVYRLLKTAGRAHEPIFTVSVAVEGLGEATASDRTHKGAEAKAAAALLAKSNLQGSISPRP